MPDINALEADVRSKKSTLLSARTAWGAVAVTYDQALGALEMALNQYDSVKSGNNQAAIDAAVAMVDSAVQSVETARSAEQSAWDAVDSAEQDLMVANAALNAALGN